MNDFLFGSVCSGIEAAAVAWHPLGWRAAFLSEIEKFPCEVLAHHYPTVPNHGDMKKFQEWPDAKLNVLVGGTPCQSFSVAGLRKGLADPRGNLMLTYGSIAQRYRPEWVVWENVPGVLSSNGGRDFGTFLGMLAELGYGFAYRILDAQFCGVPQRRRRVLVVGRLGSWQRAAAVLFERASMRGDSPPRRETREGIAGTVTAGARKCDHAGSAGGGLICAATGQAGAEMAFDMAPTLNCNHEAPYIAHALTAGGFDASEDGSGRGTPLVPIAFDCKSSGQNGFGVGDIASTMRAMGHADRHTNGGGHQAVMTATASVRRLTPRECERLQGFPDDYSLIYRGKKAKPAADGPRYKALGNSMAVPCMRWIGERIAAVEAIA